MLLRDHVLADSLRAQKYTGQVERDGVVPFFRFELFGRLHIHRTTGVVH